MFQSQPLSSPNGPKTYGSYYLEPAHFYNIFITNCHLQILMLRCHWLGHQLHRVLGDIKTAQEHATRFDQYLRDLSLYCGVCHEVIGDRPNELQALACHHIFHARYVIYIIWSIGSITCYFLLICHVCTTDRITIHLTYQSSYLLPFWLLVNDSSTLTW